MMALAIASSRRATADRITFGRFPRPARRPSSSGGRPGAPWACSAPSAWSAYKLPLRALPVGALPHDTLLSLGPGEQTAGARER